jgi:2-keto-3-deoxy-L-rhamnonate aldolase RhmA
MRLKQITSSGKALVMKGNPLRAGVERGEVQYGTWVNFARNPAVLPILKAAGLDFVRLDMEHSSPSMETVADMALLGRALEIPVVVRPPEANREWITRLLDAGIWNLHCPQVDTAEHAAAIVAASRYAPMGSRGMAGNAAGNDYDASLPQRERMDFANQQVFVTVMLESKGAFDHLEAIAAMPGIDALTIGPTDLAQDLGVFGTPYEATALDERRHMVLEAAKRHGKATAMLAGTPEEARKWADAGALLLGYSSEVGVLQDGYKRALKQIKGE